MAYASLMEVAVRRLGLGDEDVLRLLAVESARFDEQGADAKPEPTADAATALLASDEDHLLVAFEGDEPVGFLLAHELLRRDGAGRTFFVYEVGARDDRRRQGIGRSLLEEAFALARKRGASRAFVMTNESNEPAMALYRSLGGERQSRDDVVLGFRL